ncbi:hypothetical protein IT417_00590 [bacterium]|nr:hypothetical protein [bacterium]
MEQSTKGLNYLNVINGSIQTKTYSFAVFTIIVVIVLVAGAIRPTVTKIGQINKEIKVKRQINEQLETKTNAIASLTNQYADNKANIDTLPLVFPSQGNFSLLMSNLEVMAKNNGFNLVGINFGAGDKVNLGITTLKPWSVRMTVKGNRANFIKFLEQLEAMPMFPTIIRVTYSNTVDDDGLTPYTIEMRIYKLNESTFYE